MKKQRSSSGPSNSETWLAGSTRLLEIHSSHSRRWDPILSRRRSASDPTSPHQRAFSFRAGQIWRRISIYGPGRCGFAFAAPQPHSPPSTHDSGDSSSNPTLYSFLPNFFKILEIIRRRSVYQKTILVLDFGCFSSALGRKEEANVFIEGSWKREWRAVFRNRVAVLCWDEGTKIRRVIIYCCFWFWGTAVSWENREIHTVFRD